MIPTDWNLFERLTARYKALTRKEAAVVVAAALLLLGSLFVIVRINSSHMIEPVDVTIVSGDSASSIARKLEAAGVIDSQWPFKLLVRLSGKAGVLKLGLYHFEGELSTAEVLEKIESGSVMRFQVTVPEGLRTLEILKLLAEQTGTDEKAWRLAAESLMGDEEWEGRLLPETYTYAKPADPVMMIKQMMSAQQDVLNSITSSTSEASRIRIVASIIEKETSLDRERPLVAAAIYNRLKIGMPLQMDPTVIYGIWRRDGDFSGNIHKRDLRTDTPWNSYTRKGLPPTPICNPGSESLRAAANPADVSYLYFVADGSGGHAFASTHEEHQANVKRWVEIERERNRQ